MTKEKEKKYCDCGCETEREIDDLILINVNTVYYFATAECLAYFIMDDIGKEESQELLDELYEEKEEEEK